MEFERFSISCKYIFVFIKVNYMTLKLTDKTKNN